MSKTKFSLLIASLLISGSVMADKGAAIAAKAKYDAAAKNLITMINSGKVEDGKAKELVMVMVAEAQVIAKSYSEKHPTTKKLIEYVLSNMDKLKAASFDALQKDWHDAGALTVAAVGIDLKKEENETHLDPIHVLVHPLMTLSALQSKDLKAAKEELAEALEQAESSVSNL